MRRLVEDVVVTKRRVPKSRVEVSRVTHSHQQVVDDLLLREHVEIERTPINLPVDTMPSVREEQGCVVVPVVEEVLTIERRLILKEEVRIRRVKERERFQVRVTLRTQDAVVKRCPVDGPGDSDADAAHGLQDEPQGASMSYEKVVTLFDTADHADAAKRNLEKAGFSTNDISIVSKVGLPGTGATLSEPGLWHRLFGRNIEEHEARVYGRTVEDGGVVLTLRVPKTEVPRALGILNQHAVVDVQKRAIETGTLSKAAAAPIPPTVAAAIPARPLTADIGKSEVLRLAEEQLEVGKRLVSEGTTRIRRFITEKPVEAKVTLHEEHVEVIRRAVSDPTSVRDIDWADRTIEMLETDEEAVITKSAHIAEEVEINRRGSDRVETVRGTVRRQQIDVERTPGERERASTAADRSRRDDKDR